MIALRCTHVPQCNVMKLLHVRLEVVIRKHTMQLNRESKPAKLQRIHVKHIKKVKPLWL